MVSKVICDCKERQDVEINDMKTFKEIKKYFDDQTAKGVFIKEEPKEPFYVWVDGSRKREWYATSWYKCTICNCLWEFNYPDFPAKGFVRRLIP